MTERISVPWRSAILPRLLSATFVVALVGTALDAYSIGGVPLPWLSFVLAIGGAGLTLFASRPTRLPPGSLWYVLFLLWALAMTAGSVFLADYARLMPTDATTPYRLFVALRVLVVVAFLSCLILVWRLLELGRERELLRWTVLIGSLAALFAIYVYFAHVHGWPEPPRTRMGTGGGSQSVRFTFEFHRALGTFREPSHLASWLLVPLFTSFAWSRRLLNLPAIVMTAALLLTGSTTGLAAIVAGTLAGALLGRPFRREMWRALIPVALAFACGTAIFQALMVPYDDPRIGVLDDAPASSVLHPSNAPRPAFPPAPPPGAPRPEAPAPAAEAPAAPRPAPGSPADAPLPALADRRLTVPTAVAPETGLWDVLERRGRDLATKGLVAGTNRDYVLRFVVERPPRWLGVGLGNANLLLTRHLESPLVVSFLSLFLNVAYAGGLIGAALLLGFLLHPLLATVRRGRALAASATVPYVGAYVGVLLTFAVAVEEPTLPFALAYALLAWHTRRAGSPAAPATAPIPGPADARTSPAGTP